MAYNNYIKAYADFPKRGVVYWDFTDLLLEPAALKAAVAEIIAALPERPGRVAAIEAKGFVLGGILAWELGVPLVLIRKPELTPGGTISRAFIKEYGKGEYQVKPENITTGDSVLIAYDILAAAGATLAAAELVESCGARVSACAYIVELEYLKARRELERFRIISLAKIPEPQP